MRRRDGPAGRLYGFAGIRKIPDLFVRTTLSWMSEVLQKGDSLPQFGKEGDKIPATLAASLKTAPSREA